MDLMRFREVIPNQTVSEKWKDIVLNMGGSQSTLQDIKVAEKANGYCYKFYNDRMDRNRFIYWRTCHDILELSEISLDVTLTDNHVRYKFSESPVLAVHITELYESVIILVATVNSIHQLKFSRSDKSLASGNEYVATSILKDASVAAAKDPNTFHVFGQHSSTNNPFPHLATCCLSEDGEEAYFALAGNTNLVLYTMQDGQTFTTELRQSNMMPRILSGLAGALRGKNATDGNFVNSLLFKFLDKQLHLFSLHRDDQIKMWSLKKGNCIASANCVQELEDIRAQGTQSNSLSDGPGNVICTFLSYTNRCEFKTFDIYEEGNGQFSISLLNEIPAPHYDMIDFKMTSNRIWGLWCNSEGEFDVSSICLEMEDANNWVSVGLEMAPDQVNINSAADPRQEFCSYIFNPGRFQRSTIAKALVMFRRSNILADTDLPMHLLKDRVCQAIEMELQNEVRDFDVTDDEYIDFNLQLWERFYSSCEQYHTKASQPIGLVSLEELGGMCIVKKNMFSIVRPCELLEHLMLASDQIDVEDIHFLGYEDREENENLVRLISILSDIDKRIPNDSKIEIYTKLYEMQTPSTVIGDLINVILAEDYENQPLSRGFQSELREKLKMISDVPAAMMILMQKLKLSDFEERSSEIEDYHELSELQKNMSKVGNIFCSLVGKSVVSESLKQITAIRYALCRNLLILQQILYETKALSRDVLETIQSHCMPETMIFVQSYFVMKWICETPISTRQMCSAQKYDSISQLLQSLHLFDAFPKTSSFSVSSEQCSLLEHFLKGRGSILSLLNLVKSDLTSNFQMEILNGAVNWQQTLVQLLIRVGELIWPVTKSFIFGEWLIGTNQSCLIEEYVRLNSWCEWNKCSREFILAVTMLNNGELYKSYDYFIKATKGVYTEKFLFNKILNCSSNQDLCKQSVIGQYYLKVIQLFEQKPALDCVIQMAEAAIEILSEIDSSSRSDITSKMAMFQSIVFMNHLKLEHYEEAYKSLIKNVEIDRRREGLRQLVVSLFQKKRLDLLMHFPYIGLRNEFENIVEMRARTMGIEDNVHYKFLYAYHVTKENMRKAAFCMYEQAMRYQLECDTVGSMEARYESLLVCINALHLVDPKYQFIAKPLISKDNQKQQEKVMVEILEIKDIKKELVQTEAILTLNRFQTRNVTQNPDAKILRLNAQELVAVLASSHLYTLAIRLAQEFGINIESVIKSLTATCIDLSTEVFQKTDAWHWLQENDVAHLPPNNSPVDTAWNLLQKLIQDNEEEGKIELHRACAEQILSSASAFIPQWLMTEYKLRNSNGLLHLFVKHGRLVEASEFAIELIWGFLGRGYEYYGLNNPLLANGAALCFPINTVDLLIYNLKVNINENGHKLLPNDLEELKSCLKNVVDVCLLYKEKLVQVSHDKANYEKHVAKVVRA